MRKRKIPVEITRWILSLLSDRTTRMRFKGIITDLIPTPTGIPQGSPLSPILYVLYNSDLLDLVKGEKQLGLGYIDDLLYGVQNKMALGNTRELGRLVVKTEQWRQQHGAQFEKSKYVLIHFTRNSPEKAKASVTISGIKIEPSETAKYLGVTFDQKLKFHSHVKQVVAKVTKYTIAISGIAKSRWGPEFKYLKRLFTAVAAPRIDYAAIVWHRPKDTHTTPTTAQLRALSSLQGRIMRAITGCFHTTAITAMEHETELLSPQWHLTSKILRTVTRMISTAKNHPIQVWITRALTEEHRSYITNLENLIKHFPEHIQPNMEHIETYIRPPWWKLATITSISASNKDKAAEEHKRRLRQIPAQDLIIYTDGSGHGGHIGAAIYTPTINITKGEYIGTDNTHNVYAAELKWLSIYSKKESKNIQMFTSSRTTSPQYKPLNRQNNSRDSILSSQS